MLPNDKATDGEFEKLIGDEIGAGTSRRVFEICEFSDYVLKESRLDNQSNWTEYIIYVSLRDRDYQKHLGACISISKSGRFLIMERLSDLNTQDLSNRGEFPIWATDRKPSAFGKDKNGVIKLRDYGTLALATVLDNSPTLKLPTHQENAAMRKLIDVASGVLKGSRNN